MTSIVLNNSWGAAEVSSSAAMVSGSFSPAAGDLIVVKITADGSGPIGGFMVTDSASALTWTNQPNFGFSGTNTGWFFTAPVVTAPGSITVTATPAAAATAAMCVEWWSGAQLAATPATAFGDSMSNTITTAANSSVVSWMNADFSDAAGARTYITTSAIPVEEYYAASSSHDLSEFVYQAAVSAGIQHFGLTAPTGENPTMWAIEIQPSLASTTAFAGLAAGTGRALSATTSGGGTGFSSYPYGTPHPLLTAPNTFTGTNPGSDVGEPGDLGGAIGKPGGVA